MPLRCPCVPVTPCLTHRQPIVLQAGAPVAEGGRCGTAAVTVAGAAETRYDLPFREIMDRDVATELEGFVPAYDLHTHTVYSGHAHDNATVANLIARARELKLEYFGISEHVFFADEASSLFSIEHDIRLCDAGQTRVLLGVEVDPNPLKADGSWATHDLHVDYVILSPHMLPHSGLGAGELESHLLSPAQREELGRNWLDWYGRCIEHGGMDILGHPLREPMTLGLLSLRDSATLRRAVQVLSLAAKRGIAFELNEAWLCNLLLTGQYEPYLEMMRELRCQGLRFSRGSDAHSPLNVGNCREITHIARELRLQEKDWICPQDFGHPADWEV